MSATRCPLHLLALGETLTDYGIHRGFRDGRRNRFARAVALAIIDQAVEVGFDVDTELMGGPCKFARLRIIELQLIQVLGEALNRIDRAHQIPMPEQPLDALQRLEECCALLLIIVCKAARELTEHGQAHGDVKPIQYVLARWCYQFGQRAHLLAAIGEEGDLLIGLQTLTLEQFEEPAFGPLLIGMDQAHIARRAVLGQGAADDEFKVALAIVPVAHIAAIEADDNAAFRNRQLPPLRRAAINEAVLLLAEFCFGTFSYAQYVLTDGHGLGTGDNRQNLCQQFSGGSVGHERGPARFQVEALGRYFVTEQIAKRRDGARSLRTAAGTGMQALAAQLDVAKECVIGERIAAFDSPRSSTILAIPVTF